MQNPAGMLYVVSTPIGNLDDLTQRALNVLRDVSVVAAEDTRHSGRLLEHLGLQKFLLSYHDHNEEARSHDLLRRLHAGEDVALISDAGTPLVSDPGYRLVRACQQEGIRVVPVPGASAVMAAVVASGLPCERFRFEGFAPAKGVARQEFLQRVASSPVTSILYEAPHRILALLENLRACSGDDREVALCRELTKRFETVLRGTVAQLQERVAGDPDQQRGEMVLVVGGAPVVAPDERDLERLGKLLLEELPLSRAAKVLAAWSGRKRAEVYRLLEQWSDTGQR